MVVLKTTAPEEIAGSNPATRTEYIKEYQKNWIKQRREQWIKENGPCKVCGTWDELEIDHIDPRFKDVKISGIWSRTEVIRNRELAKCQVLCHDCHRKKTNEDNGYHKHGTISNYRRGCRCDECKIANRNKTRRQRWHLFDK